MCLSSAVSSHLYINLDACVFFHVLFRWQRYFAIPVSKAQPSLHIKIQYSVSIHCHADKRHCRMSYVDAMFEQRMNMILIELTNSSVNTQKWERIIVACKWKNLRNSSKFTSAENPYQCNREWCRLTLCYRLGTLRSLHVIRTRLASRQLYLGSCASKHLDAHSGIFF